MRDAVSEKFGICIAIETMTADVYHSLARLFPGDRDFWKSLAASEENHSKLLLAGARELGEGNAANDLVPESLSLIDETFRLISRINKRIEMKDLSLEEAIELALEAETSTAEHYLQMILSERDSHPFLARLCTVLPEEKMHMDLLSDFRRLKGLDPGFRSGARKER
jgi:rubrerythrin